VGYRVLADNNFLSLGFTRSRIPPWGLKGGRDGTTNYIDLLREGERVGRYSFATGIALKRGDLIRIVTGNGGGFGDPLARDAGAVRADIRDGYVTQARALEVYGAVLVGGGS
jgi:N-methylhydantoinase B